MNRSSLTGVSFLYFSPKLCLEVPFDIGTAILNEDDYLLIQILCLSR